MASLIDMRRRIRAVKNTQQITKAMKMVAASKLRRAQERVVATRPFARESRRMLASIASRVDHTSHPLLAQRPGARSGATLIIVITGDRGLCGSFNTNIIKAAGAFLRDNPGRAISLGLVGRKGRDMLGRRGVPVRFEHVNLPKHIQFAEAEAIAAPAMSDFIEGKVDSVHLVYNEFKSVMAQKLTVEQLLPLEPISGDDAGPDSRQRVHLRAVGAADLRRDAGPAGRGAGHARAARVERRVLRRADDRDGRGHAQLR